MKRLASHLLLISICMLCSVCASAASGGSAGKGIKWTLDKGVLTISGTGPMKNFGKDRPWIPSFVKKN